MTKFKPRLPSTVKDSQFPTSLQAHEAGHLPRHPWPEPKPLASRTISFQDVYDAGCQQVAAYAILQQTFDVFYDDPPCYLRSVGQHYALRCRRRDNGNSCA